MANDQDILDAFKQLAENSAANDKSLLELSNALVNRLLELDQRVTALEKRIAPWRLESKDE
jgi:hypothetical protein